MSAILSANSEQCTSNGLKRANFRCILLVFTKLRLASNRGPLSLLLIRGPAKIEPINGLRCAEPLVFEGRGAVWDPDDLKTNIRAKPVRDVARFARSAKRTVSAETASGRFCNR